MRLSAKGFLVDAAGRLLLLDCTDPARPGVRWWELPGGGVEPGEDEVDALVREVLEETGLTVGAAQVGPLAWTQESTFLHRGERRWTRCHGRVVRLDRSAGSGGLPATGLPSGLPDAGLPDAGLTGTGLPDVALTGTALTQDEQDTILGARWWTPQELAAASERFFPRNLVALLPRVLAGERVDESFDEWD